MPNHRSAAVLASLLVTACLRLGGDEACGADDPSLAPATCVANDAEGSWTTANAWTLREDLRIGTADEGPASFARIKAIEVDAAGRIYVLEAEPEQIRVFAADGAFIRTIGRTGGGPGEFQQAEGMAWDSAGRLWVINGRNNRYSVFDTAGVLAIESRRPISGYSSWTWRGVMTDSGRVIEVAMRPGDADMRLVLLRLDNALAVRDTVELPSYKGEAFELHKDGMHMSYAIRYAPSLVWTLDRSGGLWYAITDKYRIVHRPALGAPSLVIEKAFTPVPVTEAEKDTAMQWVRPFVQQGGVADRSRIPSVKPPISNIIVDDRGYLWVSVPHAGESRYDVFDPTGHYLGAVSVPARVRAPILIRGSTLYAAGTDDNDTPVVLRYNIQNR